VVRSPPEVSVVHVNGSMLPPQCPGSPAAVSAAQATAHPP